MNPRLMRPFRAKFRPADIFLSNAAVPENSGVNYVVGTLSAIPGAGYTFQVIDGPFNVLGNQLRTSADFNYEESATNVVTIRAYKWPGLYRDETFTITVGDVNEAPTGLALSASTIAENNAINDVIGTFSTTDPDAGNTFTYTLVAGTGDTDNASFNISGSSLRASEVFDYETKSSYSIRVRSTDQGSLFTEQAFTITVTDVSESQALELDPEWANVSLLLHADGTNASTTFTDDSTYNHTVTANGNAQISTAQSKFGGASAYFDGTGDWLTIGANDAFAFGTGPFTVEFWIYWDGVVNGGSFMCVTGTHNSGAGGGGRVAVYIDTTGIRFFWQTEFPTGNALATNQWVHVAGTRDASGNCRTFLDGVLVSTVTDTGNMSAPQGWRVGNDFQSGRVPFLGYIDDLRITKGVALYTGNFTPPSAPHPDPALSQAQALSLLDISSLDLTYSVSP